MDLPTVSHCISVVTLLTQLSKNAEQERSAAAFQRQIATLPAGGHKRLAFQPLLQVLPRPHTLLPLLSFAPLLLTQEMK
jgi:hypothetical protein